MIVYDSIIILTHRIFVVVFARQARKAVLLEKPLVVHSRKAAAETLTILKECVPVDWKIHVRDDIVTWSTPLTQITN